MKVDYTALSGGLDLVSGAFNVKPGRLAQCINFEQVFGRQGYHRIDGYERFDGRPAPHQATYQILDYVPAPGPAIAMGDTVVSTEPQPASALVVGVEPGCLVLAGVTGAWAAGHAIAVGADVRGTASAASYVGRVDGAAAHAAYMLLAANLRRDLITPVPGEGPVLGVAAFKEWVVAFRNAPGGGTAAMWRSSPLGWQLVRAGLLPGGRYDFVASNFSGDSKQFALYGVDGVNPPFSWDGAAFVQFGPIFGSQAASTSSIAVGAGAKSFTITGTSRSWQIGDVLTVYSLGGVGNRMTGAVTAYAHPNVTLNVDVAEGSGTHADWLIGQASREDIPYLVASHRDHLFLAYPRGQLQTSAIGEPLSFGTTAGLFGLGDTITGIVSLKGAVLGVFCENKIRVLSGSSSLDWALEPYSNSMGAKRGTALESSGNALFLDERGLTSFQAGQSFGDFEAAIFSREIKPLLDKYTPSIAHARLARSKFQYRLYAGDVVLVGTNLNPSANIQPSDVAFTFWQYAHQVSCIGMGELLSGSESMFFGTADGFVMREDVGTSFDGQAIPSVLRLHFNHLKSPANKKRYRKIDMEIDAPGQVQIRFRQFFDSSDGHYAASGTYFSDTPRLGGQWNTSDWDEFSWSLPVIAQAQANIDGVGRNMGLMLWHESAADLPFTLQGMLLQYSILGLAR